MRSRLGPVIGSGLVITVLSGTLASGEPSRAIESVITATCATGGGYEGSIHAAIAYPTLWEESNRKSKLLVQCKSGPAAVYGYDYGDAAKTSPQAAFLGGKLSGGAGPAADHPDELRMAGGLLVALSGPGIFLCVSS